VPGCPLLALQGKCFVPQFPRSSTFIHFKEIIMSITLTGNDNANTLIAGSNTDHNLYGLGGNDTLIGKAGNDVLDGGSGADTMLGAAGDDYYYVDDAGDVVVENAGEGNDWVFTSVSHTLSANVENLWLLGSASINGNGNSGANLMQGNSGDNVLDGRLGSDTMYGGAGNDTYFVESSGDVVGESAGAGIDTVRSNLANYVLGANVENLRLEEGRYFSVDSSPFVLAYRAAGVNGTGNSLANVIEGNSQSNHLDGGAGNDSYDVDSALDVVTEAAGEGFDSVYSSVNYTLGANLEKLYLTGSANINGSGNALDNRIKGNDGNNTLDGSSGADTLIGAAGNDIFIVDNVGDVVYDADPSTDVPSSGGLDAVIASVSFTLSAPDIENLSLTGSAAINATGNALGNSLWGNAGDNTLMGLAGNDGLYGGAGADLLQGGSGADTLRGGTGNDVLRGVDNVSLANDAAEDRFFFDTALNAVSNVDLIDKATFQFGAEGVDDEICLENSIFTQLMSSTGTTSGSLGAAYYFEGAGQSGNGQFDPIGIYLDTTTGKLAYNATYGSAGDATLFAVVNNGVAGGSASLSAEEFTLV
jgi:Ca2+-binding RTX toxin-like protein